MAELSTIARPYAQGLLKAAVEAKLGKEQAEELACCVDAIAQAVASPDMAQIVGDPKVTDDALYDAVAGTLGADAPELALNLLRVVVENARLEAMGEIARQFREIKNLSEGVADAYIETAFEMKAAEIEALVASLGSSFPGVKLTPVVTVNKDLIGGVRVRVGDRVLDGSIRTRLAQMQESLTA